MYLRRGVGLNGTWVSIAEIYRPLETGCGFAIALLFQKIYSCQSKVDSDGLKSRVQYDELLIYNEVFSPSLAVWLDVSTYRISAALRVLVCEEREFVLRRSSTGRCMARKALWNT